MTEELYWRAQWLICQLEDGLELTAIEQDDALDILLVTSNVTKILGA